MLVSIELGKARILDISCVYTLCWLFVLVVVWLPRPSPAAAAIETIRFLSLHRPFLGTDSFCINIYLILVVKTMNFSS